MVEVKEAPSLPSDRLSLTDNSVFRGSGYVYRKGIAGLSITEVPFATIRTTPLMPFFYNKPIENPTDPTQPPTEFVKDEVPRLEYYPLSYVELAMRPPNHLYEVDDALFAAVNRGPTDLPKWETRYFPKGSLDEAVWNQALEILGVKPPLEIKSQTSRLSLRQFTPTIARDVFDLIDRNRGHLSQFGDETAEKYPSYESLLESIVNPKNPKRLRFAMRNSEGAVVGSINLTPDSDNPKKGEVGYYLGSEYQGMGFAADATKLLSEFAFAKLGYTEIYAKIHPDNKGSQKVVAKAGYKETGTKDGDLLFTRVK